VRLFMSGVALFTFLVVNSAATAAKPPIDLTGPWSFTWDNDSRNVNDAVLKHEAGVITGTYLNDAKEKCAVAGRMNSSGTGVTLFIVCPKWDIECDGSMDSLGSVTGKYVAYGSSNGSFQMSKKSNQP
jgi:hypothetical protein